MYGDTHPGRVNRRRAEIRPEPFRAPVRAIRVSVGINSGMKNRGRRGGLTARRWRWTSLRACTPVRFPASVCERVRSRTRMFVRKRPCVCVCVCTLTHHQSDRRDGRTDGRDYGRLSPSRTRSRREYGTGTGVVVSSAPPSAAGRPSLKPSPEELPAPRHEDKNPVRVCVCASTCARVCTRVPVGVCVCVHAWVRKYPRVRPCARDGRGCRVGICHVFRKPFVSITDGDRVVRNEVLYTLLPLYVGY